MKTKISIDKLGKKLEEVGTVIVFFFLAEFGQNLLEIAILLIVFLLETV